MKFILLGIFAGFFVVLPLYVLNSFVMPQLNSLENLYAQAGAIAQQVADSHSNQ